MLCGIRWKGKYDRPETGINKMKNTDAGYACAVEDPAVNL